MAIIYTESRRDDIKGSEMIRSRLMEKGVVIHLPETVHIEETVDPARIEPHAVIHAGSRIRGKATFICSGSVIGEETPATIDNCHIGPGVRLKGGFFKDAVFLKGAAMGSGAHVRAGTIFEEYASAAHQAGLKQTILFPFVTLGSLVNFCDCLMAGGTGPKNHSEVGSSYIHFNFTPQQDKATPSMIGNVPQGVMLNQKPIFLGGQGGLVGPARLAFGTVIAAGTICRSDELREGRLLFGGPSRSGNIPYNQDFYRNIKNIVLKNLHYVAGLASLMHWYDHVRVCFVSTEMPLPLFEGLKANLGTAIEERVSRLSAFAGKMGDSAAAYEKFAGKNASEKLLAQKRQLFENREKLCGVILSDCAFCKGHDRQRDFFLQALSHAKDIYGTADYLGTIQGVDPEDAETGVAWLQGIIDTCLERWTKILTAFS